MVGSVTGIASLIGYLPDSFIHTMYGWWIDSYDFTTAYNKIFTFCIIVVVAGTGFALLGERIIKKRQAELRRSRCFRKKLKKQSNRQQKIKQQKIKQITQKRAGAFTMAKRKAAVLFGIVFDDEVRCMGNTCISHNDLPEFRPDALPSIDDAAASPRFAALQAENSFCTILLKVNEAVYRK